jgi:hypothetical protein
MTSSLAPFLVSRPPILFIGIARSVAAPPCQTIVRSAVLVPMWTVTTTSLITARSSCLRSMTVVEHGLDISAGPGDPGQCTGGERDRLAGLLGTQAVLGLPDGR